MKHSKVLFITRGAMIAAGYVVLTYLSSLLGLASGVIQVRLSEALTVLPAFTSSAIPGLYIGCMISNLITGGVWQDVIFGSLATLIGAVFTYLIRKVKYLAPLPPIVSNALIVPFVLRYAYGAPDALPYMMFTVGVGEVISAGVLGTLLIFALGRYTKAKNNKL